MELGAPASGRLRLDVERVGVPIAGIRQILCCGQRGKYKRLQSAQAFTRIERKWTALLYVVPSKYQALHRDAGTRRIR